MSFVKILSEKIETKKLWDASLVLERNEFLKTRGSINTDLYFITEGSLRIFVIDESEEHTIRFGYKNNFITSLDSFITGQVSQSYIQALKKTYLKVISKESFFKFLKTASENNEIWRQILEQLVVQQLEREIDILTSSPHDRYRRVLKRSPQLFQEIPNKYIASYLRMTPETLSRIKKS